MSSIAAHDDWARLRRAATQFRQKKSRLDGVSPYHGGLKSLDFGWRLAGSGGFPLCLTGGFAGEFQEDGAGFKAGDQAFFGGIIWMVAGRGAHGPEAAFQAKIFMTAGAGHGRGGRVAQLGGDAIHAGLPGGELAIGGDGGEAERAANQSASAPG